MFIKGSIFVILSEFFSVSWWFNASVAEYWKNLLSFSLMVFIIVFLFNHDNLYIIHHILDLSYDIYNTINEQNQRENHYLPCFQPNLRSRKKRLKKFFWDFIWLIINHDFDVINFWMHHMLFINVIRGRKISFYL